MNHFISKYRSLSMALVFTGLFAATNLAVAQQTTEEIIVTVHSERVTDISPVGSQVKVHKVEINKLVSISDLDLSKPADADEFLVLVTAIAEESCQKLSNMFPLDRSIPMEMSTCIKNAVEGARKQSGANITAGH